MKKKRYERVEAFVDGRKETGKIFTSMSFTDGEVSFPLMGSMTFSLSWLLTFYFSFTTSGMQKLDE